MTSPFPPVAPPRPPRRDTPGQRHPTPAASTAAGPGALALARAIATGELTIHELHHATANLAYQAAAAEGTGRWDMGNDAGKPHLAEGLFPACDEPWPTDAELLSEARDG